MTTRSGYRSRHLASSPFKPEPEQVVEEYALDERVCHQSYGLGRVVGTEAAAITVDFGNRTVRIVSPFRNLEKL
jgi:hypothetical protein